MVNERAKQFLPFDSLKGFKAEIRKREKIIVSKKRLSEETARELSYKINQISQGVSETSKILLDNKLRQGVKVPILAFTGIAGLEGYGKSINYKLLSISTVNCGFYGEFKSVGINQTLHSIYVEIKNEVRFSIPFQNRTESFVSSVLITETVLIGSVPDVYLNGKIFN